jgi:hypothetical protein
MVRITIFSNDMSQLAYDLSGIYQYSVVKSSGGTSWPFITLDVPSEYLDSISRLPSVLGVYIHPDISEMLSTSDGESPIDRENSDPGLQPASIFDAWQHGTVEAWANGFTGAGVKVAVPYGIDFGNPDLQGRQARNTNASSPYYNWPIVFDFNSMSQYLLSGGNTENTWFVNTSAERELNYTEIYDMAIDTESEWLSLSSYYNNWEPESAGEPESFVLDGFTPGKPYVFAIRAKDEAGNLGPISNSATATAKEDSLPPSTITDLTAVPGQDHGTVFLSWTAPGDDSAAGAASSYLIRYSSLPIANIHCFRHLSTEIQNIIVPANSGTVECMLAEDLEAGKGLYFAVVAVDEAGNWGYVSNTNNAVVTKDTAGPEAISGITATASGADHTGVILNWTAPHDEGTVGSACARYEGRYSPNPILTQTDWDSATVIPDASLPIPATPGTAQTARVTTGLDNMIMFPVANETVYGPAVGDGTEDGPWFLDNVDTTDLTLYRGYDDAGSWALQKLQQGTEYTFDAQTSEINLIGWPGAILAVVNETAITGPVDPIPDFYLAHGNILNVILYYWYAAGSELYALYEDFDYYCDDATGRITGLNATWGFLEPGDAIFAYYNYTNLVTSLQAGDSLMAYYNYTAMVPINFALRGVDELGRFGDIAGTSSFVALDEIAPAQVTGLTVETGTLHGMVYMNFTAPGDDETTGNVKRYVVKCSQDPITSEAEFSMAAEWIWADPNYSGMLPELRWNIPKQAGQVETYQFGYGAGVPFLSLTTPTYFAIKAMDEAGNLGIMSACSSAVACNDVTPPATVILTADTGAIHGSVMLSWTAPGDDGTVGQLYNTVPYTIKWSTSPIDTPQKFDDANGMTMDTAKSPGQTEFLNITGLTAGQQFYFAVRARDDANLLGGLPISTFASAKNDMVAPLGITLVTATGDHDGQVKLNFNAPGNDGSTGTASGYEVRYRDYIPAGQFIQYGFDPISNAPHFYNVTGITSQSGLYRIGMHVDENLATYVNGNMALGLINYSAVLLVDTASPNHYDTVFVDLDHDRDFSDEKACARGDEISWRDIDGDGLADVSGGMIYFVSDGTTPIPYSDIFSTKRGVPNIIPDNGDLVAFFGEYDLNSIAGTGHASAVAGQGIVPHPDFPDAFLSVGQAPDATIIGITDSMFDGMTFAVEGYDGVPGTGDEADIVTNVLSLTSTYETGFDLFSRYIDWLIVNYSAGNTAITATTGEQGPGYGTVTSPGSAPGVITAGLATDFYYRALGTQYEGGPNPCYGDVISVSGRGPTIMGTPKPDIVAAGAYFSFVSQPLYTPESQYLAPYNNLVELWMSGHSLTASTTAGGLALIYDAYGQANGFSPSSEVARTILMSGADDLGNDVFVQGAGLMNLSRSTEIAFNSGGAKVHPSSWVPGDYAGVQYEAFVRTVCSDTHPENLGEAFTVTNMGSTAVTANISAEIVWKTGEATIIPELLTIDSSYGHTAILLNRTGFFDRNGNLLRAFDTGLWDGCEFLKISAIEGTGDYWLETFDWTDTNFNGLLDQDKTVGGDAYSGALGWGERNRLNGHLSYLNVHEVRVHHPAARTHDGIYIWNRLVGEPQAIELKVEFYARQTWDWLNLSADALNIEPGQSGSFTCELDKTKAIGSEIGTYQGQVAVEIAGKTTVISVVVNVAAEGPEFSFGGDSAINVTETLSESPLPSFYTKYGNIVPGAHSMQKNGVHVSEHDEVVNEHMFTNSFWVTDEVVLVSTGVELTAFLDYGPGDEYIGPGSYTLYQDGSPLSDGTDYFLNLSTGEISFPSPPPTGSIIIADYYYYYPEITEVWLPHGELFPGFRGPTNLMGYVIYKNGLALNSLNVAVNEYTGKLTFTNPLAYGDEVSASYHYGSYDINLTLGLVSIYNETLHYESGDVISFDYSYTGTDLLFDAGAVTMPSNYGSIDKSGDWRYYYTTVSEPKLFGMNNTKFLIKTQWTGAQTDIDSFAFGSAVLTNPATGGLFALDRYGPYSMQNNGGSLETTEFFTTTGGPLEYAPANIGTGLNVIAVHAARLDGSSNIEPFQGEVGQFALDAETIDIVTNSLVGQVGLTCVSSMDLDAVDAQVFGTETTLYPNMEVWQDDPNWEHFPLGFAEQLASGNTTVPIAVNDCTMIGIHIMGHADAPDLDLGIFLDSNEDGITQFEEFIDLCADWNSDEYVTLLLPQDGTYLIRVFGFNVITEPAHYDLEITETKPGVIGFSILNMDYGQMPENTFRTFNLSWDFLGSTTDGYHYARLYNGPMGTGPIGAAMCFDVPVTLLLDRALPEIGNMMPAHNSTGVGTNPVISASYFDALSGLDVPFTTIALDGLDVTSGAVIGSSALTYVPVLPLNEGLHIVEVTVRDIAGNSNTAYWWFTVGEAGDTTSPSHFNEYPPMGTGSGNLTPAISICVTDLSGVNSSSIEFYINGFQVFHSIASIPDGYNVSYWHVGGFEQDEPVFCRVIVQDIFGNILDYSWNFVAMPTEPAYFIELSQGWNLVSLPLIQENTSVLNVLSSIDGSWDVVKCYLRSDIADPWKTYRVGGISNDLWNLDHTMGFWLNATEACVLYVTGTEPVSTDITLYAGWNLVGYPTMNSTKTVADALWGTGADSVEVFQTEAPYIREAASSNVMGPGDGYWVHVMADTVWVINW